MVAVPDVPLVPPGVDDFPEWNAISGPLDAKSLLGKEFEQELDIFDLDPTWLDRLDMGFDDLTQSMLDGVVPEISDNIFKEADKDIAQEQSAPKPPFSDEDVQLPDSPPVEVKLEDVLPGDCHAKARTPALRHVQLAPSHVPEWMRCENGPLDIATFIPPSLRPVDAQTLMERAVDRRQRLARYREKKKNRHFKKTIRYASRKAYAEVRPRVKGRFARKDEVEAMRAAGLLPCA